MIPTLEEETLEIFKETLKENNLTKIKIYYPIEIIGFNKEKNKYLFEPVCKDPVKIKRVSVRNLSLQKYNLYLLVQDLKKTIRNNKEHNVELPQILGLGKLVDENNIPFFSKRKTWYVLPKERLEELCKICYDLD